MSGHRTLAVILTALLAGCAGLNQFPDRPKDYATALNKLDAEYESVLAAVNATGKTAEEKKAIRNHFIERRLAVIDEKFREFETRLAKEGVRADFGVALVGVGVGGAGALVSETASQILSAVSGGLAGAQAAYTKAVLFDKTFPALLAQMHAGRKAVAAEIFSQWDLDLKKYPMWRAKWDLEAYNFAGSIPGAIVATSAAAKALMMKIETAFPKIKPFINVQYTAAVRGADADGSKAKVLLRRVMVLTVKSKEAADTWQTLILGL